MNLISAFRLSMAPARPDVIALVGGGGKSTTLFRLAGEISAQGKRVITTTTTRLSSAQVAESPAYLLVESGTMADRQPALRIDWQRLDHCLEEHGQCLLVTSVGESKAEGIDPAIVDAVVARAQELDIAAVIIEADGSRGRPIKAPGEHEPVVPDCTTLLVPVLGLDGVGLAVREPFVHRPQHLQSLLNLERPQHCTPEMAARLLCHSHGGAKSKPTTARLLPLLNKAETVSRLASGRVIARLLADQAQPCLIANQRSRAARGANPPVRRNERAEDRRPFIERWGQTVAVVLAAGGSSRMGDAKQLLALGKESLVVRAARTALQSGANEVIVVSGAHEEQVRAELRRIQDPRLRTVYNPDWQIGQSTSVHKAVNSLPERWDAVMFLPVDQPALPVTLLRRLWRLWRQGHDLAAPEVDGHVRGAPAVFDRRYRDQLVRVEGDRGGGPLLHEQSDSVATIVTPAYLLEDVDTPAEWERYRSESDETG